MTAAPFFHIGFLVMDLDAAMARFSEVLGLEWTARTTTRSQFWEPGSDLVTLELDVVYSVQGPPHIELVQATDGGLYAASHGEGFHHIGVWSADMEGTARTMAGHGLDEIGIQYGPTNEVILSHFDPAALHGVMLEVIDERRRPMMEEWIRGGPFVD